MVLIFQILDSWVQAYIYADLDRPSKQPSPIYSLHPSTFLQSSFISHHRLQLSTENMKSSGSSLSILILRSDSLHTSKGVPFDWQLE